MESSLVKSTDHGIFTGEEYRSWNLHWWRVQIMHSSLVKSTDHAAFTGEEYRSCSLHWWRVQVMESSLVKSTVHAVFTVHFCANFVRANVRLVGMKGYKNCGYGFCFRVDRQCT